MEIQKRNCFTCLSNIPPKVAGHFCDQILNIISDNHPTLSDNRDAKPSGCFNNYIPGTAAKSKGRFTHNMSRPCRSPAMPCP